MKSLHLVFLLALSTTAENWNRFRGPNGTGIAASGAYPVHFGPSQNLLWSTALPPGKSSPILTKRFVFLTASRNGEPLVVCLDRKTGAIRWERKVGPARSQTLHENNEPASPTAASVGENLFAFFGGVGLVSFDSAGKLRWRTSLGPFDAPYGMATSPVVANGLVLLHAEHFGDSFVAAFRTSDGTLVWKQKRPGLALNHTTPILDGSSIVATGSGRASAYDIATGEHRWTVETPNGSSTPSALLHNGTLFVSQFALELPPAFEDRLRLLDTDRNGLLAVVTQFCGGSATREKVTI